MEPERHLAHFVNSLPRIGRRGTYIVSTGVTQHILKRVFLRDILGWLANDHGQLDLIVRDMLVHRLGRLRDRDGSARADKHRWGLYEKDRSTIGPPNINIAVPSSIAMSTHLGFARVASA